MMIGPRSKVYLLLLQALFCIRQATDVMTGRRLVVEGFGLGPAPFPEYRDMNFELFGSAFLEGDSVKITSPEQHLKGAIWSKEQYAVSKTKDFQLDLSFRVGGVDGQFFGDGFALWFVQNEFRGLGGNALGGPDFWRGLGIFFDTYNNQHLKGKKHPYIYGIMNDGGFRYEDLDNTVVVNHGCHVPLRSLEDGVLESTTARITYRKNRITLLVQPYDATDWLQCFEMKNVKLPDNINIGLTAMTGEVVDKHSMISIQLYNGIRRDPWDNAIRFEQREMPTLWDEMKHSAVIAKEFEEWEQEIEEEVNEFNLASSYADYYYFGYAKNGYVADYYGEPDNYYQDSSRGQQFEKPSLKNNYRKDQPKKSGKSSLVIELTDDEVKRIDEMISGTAIATEIQALAEARQQRIRKLRKHMEAEFEENINKINTMVKDLKKKEYDMTRRIDRLANKLNVRVKRVAKKIDKSGNTYILPFALISLFVCGGTGFGYMSYRRHMKKHLL